MYSISRRQAVSPNPTLYKHIHPVFVTVRIGEETTVRFLNIFVSLANKKYMNPFYSFSINYLNLSRFFKCKCIFHIKISSVDIFLSSTISSLLKYSRPVRLIRPCQYPLRRSKTPTKKRDVSSMKVIYTRWWDYQKLSGSVENTFIAIIPSSTLTPICSSS